MKKPNFILNLTRKGLKIFQFDSPNLKPGFIGTVPYLLFLRWLIILSVIMRFYLHRDDYIMDYRWIPVLCSIILLLMCGGISFYVTYNRRLLQSKSFQNYLIIFDIVIISVCYFLTDNYQSDFFLYYYLPIFAATDYFGWKVASKTSLGVVLSFGLVLVSLGITQSINVSSLLFNAFIPRTVFYISVVATSSFLIDLHRKQLLRAVQQGREINTLLEFKTEVDQIFDVDELLKLTVKKAIGIVKGNDVDICLMDSTARKLKMKYYASEKCTSEVLSNSIDICLACQILQSGNTNRLKDIKFDPRTIQSDAIPKESLFCVPIKSHGALQGALGIRSSSTHVLNEDIEQFLRGLASQTASAIERARILSALYEIGNATVNALELDIELESILEELTVRLGFEYVAISLVDDYRNTVEMIRGKNIPTGWVNRSKYQLNHHDILADIVRTGKTEIIDQWDSRLNKEIYERFGHAKLARVFVPIISKGAPIGVIEAGCSKERKAEILTPDKIQKVEELGRSKGKTIAHALPYTLLELIANHAINIIGADSASIHVYRFDKPLLEAGAGKATKEFLSDFPPRPNGIGQSAMKSGHPVVIDNSPNLLSEHKPIYDKGVRGIAAFPLFYGTNVLHGVLYVHFWQEHKFSQAELELEKVFAKQIEIAIQNNLLLKNISETVQRAWSLASLQNIVQSLALTSNLNLTKALENVAYNVLNMLDADNVTLYQYIQEKEMFEIPPVMAGIFLDEAAMKMPIEASSAVWKIIEDGNPRYIPSVLQEPVLSTVRHPGAGKLNFITREKIMASAITILRAGVKNEIVGLLFVNYRTVHEFNTEEKITINALASSAAIAIKTARLYDRTNHDLTRRENELTALHELDRVIVANISNLLPVLEALLDQGMAIVGAQDGDILWFNQWENILESRVSRGSFEKQHKVRLKIGEGIIGTAAMKKKSILVDDVSAEEWRNIYKKVIKGTRSELAVPLLDDDKLLGVINLEHNRVGAFSQNDKVFIETLAIQGIIATHSMDLYQKLTKQITNLRTLSYIASDIQDPKHDLDTIIELLMTGITAGEGLGFSRVMLFLTDNENRKVIGKKAIGAQTQKEAEATWKRLDRESQDRIDKIDNSLSWLLKQAEDFSIAVREKRKNDYPLSLAVQKTVLPIDFEIGALSACILEGKIKNIKDSQSDLFRNVIEQVTHPNDKGRAFTCVPLVGKMGIIGALVVDKRFLFSERSIENDDLDCLEMYANLMSMCIENDRLRANIAEEQMLKTQKESLKSVAHIINTRITIIDGSVSQLRSSLQKIEGNGQLTKSKKYLEQLSSGIVKAKEVLENFGRFTTLQPLNLEQLELLQILEGTAQEIQYSVVYPITFVKPEGSLLIKGHSTKLSDAFAELIRNSQDAMQNSNKGSRIEITVLEIIHPVLGTAVKIEFTDDGPGIPIEDKKRVFQPFFTTKNKEGSGMGLTVVKEIIEQHKGIIDEIGIPGEGAKFVIYIKTLQGG